MSLMVFCDGELTGGQVSLDCPMSIPKLPQVSLSCGFNAPETVHYPEGVKAYIELPDSMQTHRIQRQTHPASHISLRAPDTWSHLLLLHLLSSLGRCPEHSADDLLFSCFLLSLDISFPIFFLTFSNPFFSSLLTKRKSHCQSNSNEAFEAPLNLHPSCRSIFSKPQDDTTCPLLKDMCFREL